MSYWPDNEDKVMSYCPGNEGRVMRYWSGNEYAGNEFVTGSWHRLLNNIIMYFVTAQVRVLSNIL